MPAATEMYDPTPNGRKRYLIIRVDRDPARSCSIERALATRAVAIGVAGIAIANVAGGAWPWPLLAPKVDMPAWAADPSMLHLSALADTVTHRPKRRIDFNDRPIVWRVTRARVRLSGIAPGWSADGSVRDASIRAGRGRSADEPCALANVPASRSTTSRERRIARSFAACSRSSGLTTDRRRQRRESTVVHYRAISRPSTASRRATGVYDGRFQVRSPATTSRPSCRFAAAPQYVNGAYQFAVDRNSTVAEPPVNHGSRVERRLGLRAAAHSAAFTFTSATVRCRKPWKDRSHELRNDVALARILPFASGFSEAENSGFRARALMVQFPPTVQREALDYLDDGGWRRASSSSCGRPRAEPSSGLSPSRTFRSAPSKRAPVAPNAPIAPNALVAPNAPVAPLAPSIYLVVTYAVRVRDAHPP